MNTNMKTQSAFNTMVNIAPSSTEGHFISGEKDTQVVELDVVNETFVVKGASTLSTKNHTSIKEKNDALITCQVAYDPYAQAFNKSKD